MEWKLYLIYVLKTITIGFLKLWKWVCLSENEIFLWKSRSLQSNLNSLTMSGINTYICVKILSTSQVLSTHNPHKFYPVILNYTHFYIPLNTSSEDFVNLKVIFLSSQECIWQNNLESKITTLNNTCSDFCNFCLISSLL